MSGQTLQYATACGLGVQGEGPGPGGGEGATISAGFAAAIARKLEARAAHRRGSSDIADCQEEAASLTPQVSRVAGHPSEVLLSMQQRAMGSAASAMGVVWP